VKNISWQLVLGLVLIALSVAVYSIHYLFFRDVHHIFIYLVGDIAFVFIEVLLVTLVIHQLLAQREKRAMLEKMNMVIGTFYSEVGTVLLQYFAKFDTHIDRIRNDLASAKTLNISEFSALSKNLKFHDAIIRSDPGKLKSLKDFLCGKRDFLIRLLENPILLEHASFTDLLWAIFHLGDELGHRQDLKKLTKSDHEHLNGDIKRAYLSLLSEWTNYMTHLKNNYPYLFSLAIRTNPFDPSAKPEVV
jgi:hypothetical protein